MSSATPTPISRLETELVRMGASLRTTQRDGAFVDLVYVLSGMLIHMCGEYGNWRINLAVEGDAEFPASFWLAATDGSSELPNPVVSPEDPDRLAARLADVLREHEALIGTVHEMGVAYRKVMRDRLG